MFPVLRNERGLGLSIQIVGPKVAGEEKILTTEALNFVASLHGVYGEWREMLLGRRKEVHQKIRAGNLPHFPKETEHIRSNPDWKVDPPPADLIERIVEITGPASVRSMVVNAHNSGSSAYMADAEDSEAPTWKNIINGQINLYDAIRRQIDFSAKGKEYKLNEKTAVLMFRPRGWHLLEKHVLIDGEPISASLFDFGMYFFHNAGELIKRGTGVYLYLPKLESYHEAELWDAIFEYAEGWFDLPRGTIRATVLIETILAAFQMPEILHALRHHSVGLNCGRWDYLFSFIKVFANLPGFVLPDRNLVNMSVHMMKSYRDLCIKECHKRGAHCIGGMSAFVPSKDEKVNGDNKIKLEADKALEAIAGHDGTWIAHPASQKDARDVFRTKMGDKPNQLDVLREDVNVSESDLLAVPKGSVTEAGLEENIRIGLRYETAYLGGTGCVALYDKMEDAATVEISRTQVWQAVKHEVLLDTGWKVVPETVWQMIEKEGAQLNSDKAELAMKLFRAMVFAEECPEFLTVPTYEALLELEKAGLV